MLAVGGEDGSVSVLNVATRKIISSHNVGSPVNTVAWAGDKALYVGCDNGSVLRLTRDTMTMTSWRQESSSPVLCLRYHDQLARIIVSRQDGSVTCHSDLSGDNSVLSLTGADLEPVYSVCVSDNGDVHTGSRDGRVRRYNCVSLMSTRT